MLVVDGPPGIAASRAGTVPGDVIFNFVMREVLRKARAKLADKEMQGDIPLDDEGPALCLSRSTATAEVTVVDDGCFFTACSDPAELVERVAKATRIFQQCFASYGQQLNMGKNKTDVMIRPVERGTEDAQKSCAKERGARS